jgi:glycerol kinase
VLAPAIVWQDRRTADRCLELASELPTVRRITGLVLDPYFTGTKAEWLLRSGAVTPTTHLALGTIDSWILWRLSGGSTFATDESNASRTMLYDIQQVTREAIQLASLSQMCCERVRTAVGMLPNMDDAEVILKLCVEIDQLESDADRVMRSAMSKLFRDEPDVRELIKLKAIYELLETITDKCEDVANQIEGIVLENS